MQPILRTLRALWPVTQVRPRHLAVMIIVGVLTALSEGISITLVVPLIQSQTGESSGGLGGFASGLFERFPPEQRLFWVSLAILGSILIKNVLSYTYALMFQWTNSMIGHRLRSGIMRQLFAVSQSYLDVNDSGKLLNTLGSETWRVTSAFAVVAGSIINLCMILILSIILLLISWKLTLIAATLLLIISMVIRLITRRVRKLGEKATAANATLSKRMIETMNGMRLVRAFGREPYEQARFDAASHDVRLAFFRMDRISSLVRPLSEILAAPMLLGVLVVTMAYRPGEFAVSLVFLLFLYRLQPRIKQLDSDRVALESLAAPIEQVRSLLDNTDKPYIRSGNRTVTHLSGELRFEQVGLVYQGSTKPALRQVNLSIELGKTTAFIGPSGAGKSSLISLLCRFYDPSEGRVLLNGIPLGEFDLVWWREQIALVSQDVLLFNTSVADNIAYGRLKATREEIVDAARKAHALEFIEEMPNGIDTLVGDHGIRLSGGQRQRLALARAFVRDPRILILDEATNSLDVVSEQLIQDALAKYKGDRTVLIIAHRMSTVEHADKVVVVDAGTIVESGSVSTLLASGGLFSRFHDLQLRR